MADAGKSARLLDGPTCAHAEKGGTTMATNQQSPSWGAREFLPASGRRPGPEPPWWARADEDPDQPWAVDPAAVATAPAEARAPAAEDFRGA